ncbi:AlbA family DNA-binding domain-containing protein [Campylobacter concisus]|uniref:AlbA family DNA-binding domain-containing protein n=2 Tax=Campylobacter concisus TaxID=199 RepID=UPI000CD866C0|nr:ATP-binding protein [Campylobacter concisus]
MTIDDFKDLIEINSNGRLKQREKKNLEFKLNFNIGAIKGGSLSKTIAALANTEGGIIIFGIRDRPREPIGMSNNNFVNMEVEKVTQYLNEYFSPEIIWNLDDFTLEDNRKFGVIYVEESKSKPVVCIKTIGDELIEGDIYYRYSGRSQKIKYSELKYMLEYEKELERKRWIEHITNIARIGPQNIALMDVYNGNIVNCNNKNIIISKELLRDIKFIKEGKFVEKDGAPALKLIGNVEGMDGIQTIIPELNMDKDFLTTKELGKKLGWLTDKGHTKFVTAVIWKYGIQKERKYYQQKGASKFYTTLCFDFLKSQQLSKDKISSIYQEYLDNKDTK